MGNKSSFDKFRKSLKLPSRKKTVKGFGEEFYLEDWEICNDFDNMYSKRDSAVTFDSNLVVSSVKSDPLKEYTILKTLGEGSFGKVHLVQHNIGGMIRAIKIIKKIRVENYSNETSVLNELNILKKLDHQNIVKIFEFYSDSNYYYLVMEYCSGGDLFDLMQKSIFNEAQVACIMYQILSAINYCHKMKIMHRDLKPENILITKIEKNGIVRIKICDFGTSQIFNLGDVQKNVIGSLYYMAPEVFSKNYDFKCDLWSCGVMMYILLTKNIPFNGENKDEIKSEIIKGKYNEEFLRGYSKNSIELIDALLEKKAKRRINAEKALDYFIFKFYKCKELINKIKDENKIKNFVENIRKYESKTILQEVTLSYLIHNYFELEDVQDAAKLFNLFDENNDGRIGVNELYDGMAIVTGSSEISKEVVDIFNNLDTDHNNYIGFEEFLKAAVDKKVFLDEKILRFAFNHFDKNKNGEIGYEDIAEVFKDNVKSSSVEKTLREIINEVDSDKNGKISFEEFWKMMIKVLGNL